MNAAARDELMLAEDAQLLKRVNAEFVRSSGPGGQHRNKVSSGLRLHHDESGITVTATERRNQHENRRTALRRFREALAIHARSEPADVATWPEDLRAVLKSSRWPRVSPRSVDYWRLAARVLDRLAADGVKLSDTATALGVSTGSLARFFGADDGLWQEVLRMRREAGLPPLRK